MKDKTKIIILGKIHSCITWINYRFISVSCTLLSINKKITSKIQVIHDRRIVG